MHFHIFNVNSNSNGASPHKAEQKKKVKDIVYSLLWKQLDLAWCFILVFVQVWKSISFTS